MAETAAAATAAAAAAAAATAAAAAAAAAHLGASPRVVVNEGVASEGQHIPEQNVTVFEYGKKHVSSCMYYACIMQMLQFFNDRTGGGRTRRRSQAKVRAEGGGGGGGMTVGRGGKGRGVLR